jgi:hypothetical protein
MLSLLDWPKVITLSGFYCNSHLKLTYLFTVTSFHHLIVYEALLDYRKQLNEETLEKGSQTQVCEPSFEEK